MSFNRLGLLFFLFLPAYGSAFADTIDCHRFWRAATDAFNCEEVVPRGFPGIINGKSFRFFHFTDGWVQSDQAKKGFEAIAQAVIDAVTEYDKYGSTPYT